MCEDQNVQACSHFLIKICLHNNILLLSQILHTSVVQLLHVSITMTILCIIKHMVKIKDVLSIKDKGSRVGSGPTEKTKK